MTDEKEKKTDEGAEQHAPEQAAAEPADAALEEKLAAAIGADQEAKRLDPQAAKAERQEKKARAQEQAGTEPVEKKAAAKKPEGKKAEGKKGDGKKGDGKKGDGKKGDGKKGKAEEKEAFVKRTAPPRLRALYDNEVVPALQKEFGFRSRMSVPRLMKITLNMGLGAALQNPKIIEAGEAELAAISGQKPVVTKARQSVAAFKLRQGQKIGCMVTLRGDRMYEFIDRLVTFALPRTRDFRGVSPRSFDGRGNFTLGIKEQIIFPEINYDKVEKIMGLNVCVVTSARTDDEARALLRHLGMPFRK